MYPYGDKIRTFLETDGLFSDYPASCPVLDKKSHAVHAPCQPGQIRIWIFFKIISRNPAYITTAICSSQVCSKVLTKERQILLGKGERDA